MTTLPYPFAMTTTASLERRAAELEREIAVLKRERGRLRRELEKRLSVCGSVGVRDGGTNGRMEG